MRPIVERPRCDNAGRPNQGTETSPRRPAGPLPSPPSSVAVWPAVWLAVWPASVPSPVLILSSSSPPPAPVSGRPASGSRTDQDDCADPPSRPAAPGPTDACNNTGATSVVPGRPGRGTTCLRPGGDSVEAAAGVLRPCRPGQPSQPTPRLNGD